jgi:hypothetical protein
MEGPGDDIGSSKYVVQSVRIRVKYGGCIIRLTGHTDRTYFSTSFATEMKVTAFLVVS